ncbi:hypothetical protein Luutsna6_00008 [Pseudomonas phage vB_PpuP-Luutsna-6]
MIYHDDIPHPDDAMAYAVPFDEAPSDDAESILAAIGFGPTTGIDTACNHDGMLAVGLAMQAEFDNEDY